jgi:hypothetical protein
MVKKFSLIFLSLFYSSTLFGDNNYGRLLLYGNCITCHHESKSISAPSLKILKDRYISIFPKKKDFVAYMSTWVLKPNKSGSVMKDMIERYEIMPELGYDIDTLKKIAIYIYENDF